MSMVEAIWDLQLPIVSSSSSSSIQHQQQQQQQQQQKSNAATNPVTTTTTTTSHPRCFVVYPISIIQNTTANATTSTTAATQHQQQQLLLQQLQQQRQSSLLGLNPFDQVAVQQPHTVGAATTTAMDTVVKTTTNNNNNNNGNVIVNAVLIGTDHGTLHYRTYLTTWSFVATSLPVLNGVVQQQQQQHSVSGSTTTTTTTTAAAGTTLLQQQPQTPFKGFATTTMAGAGATTTTTMSSTSLNRNNTISGGFSIIGGQQQQQQIRQDYYIPFDSLLQQQLPGIIIACIPLFDIQTYYHLYNNNNPNQQHQSTTTTTTSYGYQQRGSNTTGNSRKLQQQQQQHYLQQQQQVVPSFLLLIDDTTTNMTSSSSSSSSITYATAIVSLMMNTTNYNINNNNNNSNNPFQIVASSFTTLSPNFTKANISVIKKVQQQQQQQVLLLPRMTCAYYNCSTKQILYGVGRMLHTIFPSDYYIENSSTSTNIQQQQQRRQQLIFPSNILPSPGIRGSTSNTGTTVTTTTGTTTSPSSSMIGSTNSSSSTTPTPTDSILMIGPNHDIVIVAIANTFYGVIGTYQINTNNNNDITPLSNTVGSNSNNVFKLLSLQQSSSQIYPVMIINIHDPSFTEMNYYSLFLACGRECAIVDVHVITNNNVVATSTTSTHSATSVPTKNDISTGTTTSNTMDEVSSSSLSCSSVPRNTTITNISSPILSAVASWPYMVLLLSDGLISIRPTSCLSISIRTIEIGQRPNDYFTLRTIPTIHPSTTMIPSNRSMSLYQNKIDPTSLSNKSYGSNMPYIVAMAYSGECKVIQCQSDTLQDFVDRLMKYSIDAFGTNGFPRNELADALNVSFTASSYMNSTITATTTSNTSTATTIGNTDSILLQQSRTLLKQYLEAVLGFIEFDGGARSGWPMDFVTAAVTSSMDQNDTTSSNAVGATIQGAFTLGDKSPSRSSNIVSDQLIVSSSVVHGLAGRGALLTPSSLVASTALICSTAMLCLVCSQISPPNASLANRAAKTCCERIGILLEQENVLSNSTTQVCELVAEKLLRDASSKFTLSSSASPAPIVRMNRNAQSNVITLFLEAAIWLLRSCGKHERAIDVAYERLQQQSGQQQQQQPQQSDTATTDGGVGTVIRGFWSQIKYESYTATHLSDIWSTQKDIACQLVLSSPATKRLLERNPRLGLSIFTTMHPQNEAQWKLITNRDDPLSNTKRIHDVLRLLKSIRPVVVSMEKDRSNPNEGDVTLPLESGRAIAVTFLRSAIGISTGRPSDIEIDSTYNTPDYEHHVANIHDELSLLLLEGVIVERSTDEAANDDNELGSIYRSMLRELLQWPLAKIRPQQFMEALPSSFLQEKALVLGRLGQHDDALRILYGDLNSLDLALEYCDHRHTRQKMQYERYRTLHQYQQQQTNNVSIYSDLDQSDEFDMKGDDNAYIPLIRVALDSKDTERGTATAIKVLALRRGAVDRAAALRLLPSDVPVSAIARPFLIPALVENESQVRRMTVVAALLKSRYIRLKDQLVTAQLKAQSNIHIVPALRNLNLGEPLHSTKSIRARTTNVSSNNSTMPYIEIVKYFFPRHLVIQAKVTNVPYFTYSGSNSSATTSATIPTTTTVHHNNYTLCDITFVVAESSEMDAIIPLLVVPIQQLPYKMMGSAWCVLSAIPNNMDASIAQLTCELRYSIVTNNIQQAGSSSSTNAFTMMDGPYNNSNNHIRSFVDELQDIEIHAAHFLPKSVQPH